MGNDDRGRNRWMMGFVRRLCLCGCVSACSGAPTTDGVETSVPAPSKTSCPAYTSCSPGWYRECFSVSARCVDGNVTGEYGYNCQAYAARCELGCRQDYPSDSSIIGEGIERDEVVEIGARLCE